MCDCASEDDSEPKMPVPQEPIDNDNCQSDPMKSCDCTSEDDSESPKMPVLQEPVDADNLQSKSRDCTSEDDSESPKLAIRKDKVATNDLQSNANESCDCTSESSMGTTESCDCTSEESSQGKKEICDDTDDRADNSKSPCAIVQVELSESMLNLLPSSESSTSCDCTSSQDRASCPASKDEASCDCVSESSESSSSIKSQEKEKRVEWTLAIIKPEAVIFRSEIERIIEEEEGFSICQRRWLHLTAEQASEFYCDNDQQKDFARLVAYMSSKPIAVYVLSKLDAINEWRMLIGPTKVSDARVYAPDSIRGRYGSKATDDMQNAVHGSFDERAAEREIHFFFPDCILEPLLRDEAAEEYLRKKVNDVLSEGLIKCCEEKPEDPVLWLGNWLLDSKRPTCLLRSTSNLND